MFSSVRSRFRRLQLSALAMLVLLAASTPAMAQLNVIAVDCTPFVSPGFTSFGPSNTMGMSLQQVDPGAVLFNLTEVTPAAFRALTAPQLAAYDLIAINNNPSRIDCGSGLGLGTTWHSVIGVAKGGRVFLTSHDAARFKIIIPPGGSYFGTGAPGPGVEPFGADELVRDAALWAGGGNRTGLLIFNDSARFFTVGGQGWNNPELNLPAAWGITDLDQTGGAPRDGGYTDILPAFAAHPIYANVSDARFGIDSISSFAANISDGSFHSIFASFNAAILAPTELTINSGIVNVGNFPVPFTSGPPNGPDGIAISLIRDDAFIEVAVDIKPGSCRNPLNVKQRGVLPAAILGTADFEVSEIDVSTIRLAGVAPLQSNFEDVATPFVPFIGKEDAFDCTSERADGFTDLTVKFDVQAVIAALGPVTDSDVIVVELTGELLDGSAIIGEDVIVILSK